MEDSENTKKKPLTMLLIARIFTTSFLILYSFAFLPKLIGEYIDIFNGKSIFDSGWEGMVMELTYYVFLIGYVFSWGWKCTAGIIFIVASIIQMTPFLIIDGNMGSLIFGLPILTSGIMFLAICRDERKKLS